jgi:hypothetical protein
MLFLIIDMPFLISILDPLEKIAPPALNAVLFSRMEPSKMSRTPSLCPFMSSTLTGVRKMAHDANIVNTHTPPEREKEPSANTKGRGENREEKNTVY